MRTRLAVAAGRCAAALSRRTGRGEGTAIGGRLTLLLAPDALADLGRSHRTALVSGTNGKTTTTTLLRTAVQGAGPVVSNVEGSNMPRGIAGALSGARPGSTAVLEVDEPYLARLLAPLAPRVVLLLNLSRDQLDRHHEVRHLAQGWREGLQQRPPATVVANADDPLVQWAAEVCSQVVWVAAGQPWRQDAVLCPRCATALVVDTAGAWSCPGCGARRPEPTWSLDGQDAVGPDGARHPLQLGLPGRANRANALMALAGAAALGRPVPEALAALGRVADVQGRYATAAVGGTTTRLLLAKNPAGWGEALEVLSGTGGPVVLEVNSNSADGRDPSWLWDVPFGRLAGRRVVATGDRAYDLAVRLAYAGVDATVVPGAQAAVRSLGGAPTADYVGTYTAFQALRRELDRG